MTRAMNKVEAVARAMEEAHHSGIAEGLTGNQWLEALARAAIKAMREPTEGMLATAVVNLVDVGLDSADGVGPDDAIPVWQAMIDTALAEAENEAFWKDRDDDVFGPDNV